MCLHIGRRPAWDLTSPHITVVIDAFIQNNVKNIFGEQ